MSPGNRSGRARIYVGQRPDGTVMKGHVAGLQLGTRNDRVDGIQQILDLSGRSGCVLGRGVEWQICRANEHGFVERRNEDWPPIASFSVNSFPAKYVKEPRIVGKEVA